MDSTKDLEILKLKNQKEDLWNLFRRVFESNYQSTELKKENERLSKENEELKKQLELKIIPDGKVTQVERINSNP